jgi:hypothetical protein
MCRIMRNWDKQHKANVLLSLVTFDINDLAMVIVYKIISLTISWKNLIFTKSITTLLKINKEYLQSTNK